MSEEISIRVNFSRPMPLFPLGQVVMLPQQVTPLHIFEPRYRQMISRALDGPGQIAMACIAGSPVGGIVSARPPLRPAVCVGHIVQHESLPDGRYNIILQGVCRARIVEEEEPSEDRMYREAMLEPIGEEGDDEGDLSEAADGFRAWLRSELDEGDLRRLAQAGEILELLENEEIPSPVIVEIISFALINDDSTRYALLAEGNLSRRTKVVQRSLDELASLIRRAAAQEPGSWPKGTSWN